MTPVPDRRRRGEQGHAESPFLRKLTMVCFIVLVLSGLVVYWIGDAIPDRVNDRRPTVVHHPPSVDKPQPASRCVVARQGGGGRGQRS